MLSSSKWLHTRQMIGCGSVVWPLLSRIIRAGCNPFGVSLLFVRVSKPSRRSVLLTLLLQYIQLSILSLNGNTEKRQGKRGVLITRPYEHMLLLACCKKETILGNRMRFLVCVCCCLTPLLTTADSQSLWLSKYKPGG